MAHHGLKITARNIAGTGKIIDILDDIVHNRNMHGVFGVAQVRDTRIPTAMQMVCVQSVEELSNMDEDALYTALREGIFYEPIRNVLRRMNSVQHSVESMDEYLHFLKTQPTLKYILLSDELGALTETDPDAMAQVTAGPHSFLCGNFHMLFESSPSVPLLTPTQALRLNDPVRMNMDKPNVQRVEWDGVDSYMISAGVGIGMLGNIHELTVTGP